MTAAIRRAHAAELKGYEMSTGTVRFPLTKPLRSGLVRRLVRHASPSYEGRTKRESKGDCCPGNHGAFVGWGAESPTADRVAESVPDGGGNARARATCTEGARRCYSFVCRPRGQARRGLCARPRADARCC